jgi:hypothetical protein
MEASRIRSALSTGRYKRPYPNRVQGLVPELQGNASWHAYASPLSADGTEDPCRNLPIRHRLTLSSSAAAIVLPVGLNAIDQTLECARSRSARRRPRSGASCLAPPLSAVIS